MKYYFLLLLLFLMPLSLLAHGGVEKYADTTLVFLNQVPLSPLVGEEVQFHFAFSNTTSGAQLRNMPVTLTLIDTFHGDESKDKVILTETHTTDINGDFDFSYTFNKENYFDIDLDFADPKTGKSEEVGFLVEPREPPQTGNAKQALLAAIIGILIGAVASSLLRRRV